MIVNELNYSILIELENNLISKNKPDCKINSLDNKINFKNNFSRDAIIYFYLGQTVLIHELLMIWNVLMLVKSDLIQEKLIYGKWRNTWSEIYNSVFKNNQTSAWISAFPAEKFPTSHFSKCPFQQYLSLLMESFWLGVWRHVSN